jgi:hypothetical protein
VNSTRVTLAPYHLHVMSDAPQSFGDDDRDGSHPNYLARRLGFTGLIVAVIAIVAILAGRLIDSSSGESPTVEVDTAWNTMVTVNQHTGRVVISDPDGSGAEGLSTNTGRVTATAMIDDSVFVAGARASVAVTLTGHRERLEISDLLDGDLSIERPSGTTGLVMFTNGSDGVIIGGDLDHLIDTSNAVAAPGVELAFDEARADVDGTAVLIPDPGSFQSVLLRFGDEPATYFAGVPLAVDGERVAIGQNVGGSATITVSDHEGGRLSQFTTLPVLAAMLIDGGILTVDRAGVIHLLHPNGDEVVGSLDATPTAGWVTTTGDRLVVLTADGVAVIDAGGEIRSSTTGVHPALTGPAPPSTTPLRPGCIVMHGDEVGLRLVNLRDGADVDDVSPADAAVFTSADGCTAIASAESGADSRSTVLSAADSTDPQTLANDHDTVRALSPDGDTVAIERAGRLAVEAVETTDPDTDSPHDNNGDNSNGEPDGDLGAATPFVFFADL